MSYQLVVNHQTVNKENCVCCGATYVTGKHYGDWWYEYSLAVDTKGNLKSPKGLCEFCNPNNVWYTPDLKCHKENI